MADAFGLDDDTWMRHCNPWSVYTRYSALPVLLAAIWSRRVLGGAAAIPIGIAVLWIWLNPRLFAAPRSTRNWASKAVFGERVYLQRNDRPLPDIHRSAVLTVTKSLAGVGFFAALWGTLVYSLPIAVGGTVVAMISKTWFLDRMVWLYEDTKHDCAEFQSWEYGPSPDVSSADASEADSG